VHTTAPQGAELRSVVAFVGPPRGRTLLDFGCAETALANEITAAGAAAYHGIAPTADLAAPMTAELGGTPVTVADLDRWSGNRVGRYDVVLSVRAFQHVRNLARLLETLHHHINPGGRLVFSTSHPYAAGADYLTERERPDLLSWSGLPHFHRTFAGYVRELGFCGFHVVELAEGGSPDGDRHSAAPQWAVYRCVRTP
jgi:SAM-dependent methyltransferase